MGIVDILHIQAEVAVLLAVEEHNSSSSLGLVQIRRLLSPVLRQPLPALSSWTVRRLFGSLPAIRRRLGLGELRVEVSIANRSFLP
jgi:hypothetical protein